MSTPIRRQYLEIKARHPDAILFFRLGDFYETFDDDAKLVSRELEIALTSKPMGKGLRVPLAGVPVHAIDGHLARLIQAGHRVAICEQLEDTKAAKGLVARGVVRVISPGTALDPALLESGSNNYCAALVLQPPLRRRGSVGAGWCASIAAVDLSTGEFQICELEGDDAIAAARAAAQELARLGAAELLLPQATEGALADRRSAGAEALAAIEADLPPRRTPRPAAAFDPVAGAERLERQYQVRDVEGLGLAGRPAALAAAGALLEYLSAAQPGLCAAEHGERGLVGLATKGLAHLARPKLYRPGSTMQLDAATERALGITREGRAGQGPDRSLLALLDCCRTAAGKRRLRAQLARPLLDPDRIAARLDAIEALLVAPALRIGLREGLAAVPDLERLLGRIVTGLAAAPEVAAFGRGLRAAAALGDRLDGALAEETLANGRSPWMETLTRLRAGLRPCHAAETAIAAALEDDPSADFEEGGAIRPGFDSDLDVWRAQLRAGRTAIAALEARERERSGISNLKVGFHRSFGYYLEVTSGQLARVPPEWERRQTLTGGERFVTPELRTHEREVLRAREALLARERDLFSRLCRELAAEVETVRALARGTARLDLAAALAAVAAEHGWTRPQLDRSDALTIREGRHPMVEAALPSGRFVPNDLQLDAGAEQVLVITGPNMAGKSTYLRQMALIVLLAQCGSFVPAAEARIGLVDRIFARVGAQDDLAAGQSTFMVEMLESANILAAATDRSLLVLDEIGRGTSTYDGLAIAQALLEHLVHDPRRGPRTLFATHFHELAALAGSQPRVASATVAVEDDSTGGVRFLYRIRPGGADRSYGVHVAEMAGLPPPLVQRARAILAQMEAGGPRISDPVAVAQQASLLALLPEAETAMPSNPSNPAATALAEALAALDVESLTPLEAIAALFALRDRARDTDSTARADPSPTDGAETP